ncbi:MotE family protein [Shouchella sp. JSM 1781072]|uniref:MotE family protein n=1 Tax=Bacillaceae TaxID=186817 RepID=UPI0020D02EFF|nr:hypothetical protein [Alkalihalobacillus sp. LMS6]UTR04768.1 hypothetical protein MM326_11535 [Alkalihalobacillus sp. LMS6]
MKKQKKKQSRLLVFSFVTPIILIVVIGFIYVGPLFGMPSMSSFFNSSSDTNSEAVIAELEQEVMTLQDQLRELENEFVVKEAEWRSLEEERASELQQTEENEPVSIETATNNDEVDGLQNVIKTYQQMSSKRAAAIIDELAIDVAYEHVRSMDESLRASIVGRLPADKAAQLLEQLADEGG